MGIEFGAALVSCDGNPDYLGFWPLVRRAWNEVVGVPVFLVLVAESVPEELASDPCVIPFAPIEGVSPVLQAQVVRLLAPALVGTEGAATIISDMDMVPLSPGYFRRPLDRITQGEFLVYRRLPQLPMCYNAATPETWREIFLPGTAAVDWSTVRARLDEITAGVAFEGHGGSGWFTDQELLTATVYAWGERSRRLRLLDDSDTRFARFDRKWGSGRVASPRWHVRCALVGRRYTDFHMLQPAHECRDANEHVLNQVLRSDPRARLARSPLGAVTSPRAASAARRALRRK